MTRIVVTALIALIICIAIKTKADSLVNENNDKKPLCLDPHEHMKDDPERRSNDNNEANEVAEADDTDRAGSAQAYASVTRPKPATVRGTTIKFINCFACVDCPKALANTTAKYCPYTNDQTKNKCVVYAEQYTQLKKLWYIRGCASERGSCADIRRGHENTPSVKLSFCSECEGDRCNGVSRSTSDITTALVFLVLCPVLGKYTVS